MLSKEFFKNLVYKIKKWSKVCIEDICGSGDVPSHFLELDTALTWMGRFTLREEPCYPRDSGLGETQSRARQFGEGQRKVSFFCVSNWTPTCLWSSLQDGCCSDLPYGLLFDHKKLLKCRTKAGRRNCYCNSYCVLFILVDKTFYRTISIWVILVTKIYKKL